MVNAILSSSISLNSSLATHYACNVEWLTPKVEFQDLVWNILFWMHNTDSQTTQYYSLKGTLENILKFSF